KVRWIIPKIAPDQPAPHISGTLHTQPTTDDSTDTSATVPKKKGSKHTSSKIVNQLLSVSPLVEISVEFKVAMHTASGLKIDRLDVTGEGYGSKDHYGHIAVGLIDPFKGVRAFCRSG
ncbi:hypothetical protein HDU99_008323, partial [Rhizoclosmatium hyalinum]